jgi:hypothetical protein
MKGSEFGRELSPKFMPQIDGVRRWRMVSVGLSSISSMDAGRGTLANPTAKTMPE